MTDEDAAKQEWDTAEFVDNSAEIRDAAIETLQNRIAATAWSNATILQKIFVETFTAAVSNEMATNYPSIAGLRATAKQALDAADVAVNFLASTTIDEIVDQLTSAGATSTDIAEILESMATPQDQVLAVRK